MFSQRRHPEINPRPVRTDVSARGRVLSGASRLEVNKIAAFPRQRFSPEKPPHGPRHVCVCLLPPALTHMDGWISFHPHKGAMWHVVRKSFPPPVRPDYKYPDRPDLLPLHHRPLVGACLRSALLPTHGLIYFDEAQNGNAPPMRFGHPCPFF